MATLITGIQLGGISKQIYKHTATGSAAIAEAVTSIAPFRLLRIEVKFSSAPSTSQNFTVTLDAGDDSEYDALIDSVDPSVGSQTTLIFKYGKGYEYEADDEIDIAWTNTDTRTYGLRVIYELI